LNNRFEIMKSPPTSPISNLKPEAGQPCPDLFWRAIAVFRINRTFALSDCPEEPVEVLRVGARDNLEVLMVFGAPAVVDHYLSRARKEAGYQEVFQTVLSI
jgi:hypothetical protein